MQVTKRFFANLNSLPAHVSDEVAEGIRPWLARRSTPSSLFRSRAFYEPIEILVLCVVIPKLVEIIEYLLPIFHGHV
jgi:hypothetical protein